jgi:hypothetical protein
MQEDFIKDYFNRRQIKLNSNDTKSRRIVSIKWTSGKELEGIRGEEGQWDQAICVT